MKKTYWIPTITAFLLLCAIGAPTVQAEEAYVTPEMYGANGFDQKPDTIALQQAIYSGKEVKLKEGATYLIDNRMVVRKNLTLSSGPKKAKIVQTKDSISFNFVNESKATTTVTNPVLKGQNYLDVASVKNMKVGDILHMQSNRLWYWDNRDSLYKGEVHVITKISGNRLYLDDATNDKYTGERLTVNVYAPQTHHLSNVIFSFSTARPGTMIQMAPSINSTFSHIEIYHSKNAGMLVKNNINATFSDNYVSLGTTKDISNGYGYQDFGGKGTKVLRSTFENVRRGADFSGVTPARFGLVKDSIANGPAKGTLAVGNSGFGTHSTAEYILFEDNIVTNFDYAFNIRGNHITVEGSHHSGLSKSFVSSLFGNDLKVVNNIYAGLGKTALDSFLIVDITENRNFFLRNNRATVSQSVVKSDVANLSNFTIKDSKFVFLPSSDNGIVAMFASSTPITVHDATITNNVVTVAKGKGVLFRGPVTTGSNNTIEKWKTN